MTKTDDHIMYIKLIDLSEPLLEKLKEGQSTLAFVKDGVKTTYKVIKIGKKRLTLKEVRLYNPEDLKLVKKETLHDKLNRLKNDT